MTTDDAGEHLVDVAARLAERIEAREQERQRPAPWSCAVIPSRSVSSSRAVWRAPTCSVSWRRPRTTCAVRSSPRRWPSSTAGSRRCLRNPRRGTRGTARTGRSAPIQPPRPLRHDRTRSERFSSPHVAGCGSTGRGGPGQHAVRIAGRRPTTAGRVDQLHFSSIRVSQNDVAASGGATAGTRAGISSGLCRARNVPISAVNGPGRLVADMGPQCAYFLEFRRLTRVGG